MVKPPESADEQGFRDCHTIAEIHSRLSAIAGFKAEQVQAALNKEEISLYERPRTLIIAADTTLIAEVDGGTPVVLGQPPDVADWREVVSEWFRHGSRVLETYLEAKRPLTVGIFADQPIEEVNELAEEAGVDLVQLSGDETWEDCLLVAKQVIQVLHVGPVDTPADPLADVRPGFAVALMLDSAHGPYRGGGGQVFDWDVATRMAGRLPIFLAGGLTPVNVTEAVARVRPWAVDVASGTETDGRKDYAKMRAFVQAVRAADARGGTR